MQTSTTGRKQNRAARLDRAKNRAKEPVQINLEWDEEEKRAAVDFLNNILANTDLSDNVHYGKSKIESA